MVRRRGALDQYDDVGRRSSDEWARTMSVTDRNEIEAGGGARLLPFEGDERLRIPAGTEDDRVRAIRRYWAMWPEHRDAVLERYDEALKRAADFRKRYHSMPPVAALQNVRRDDPSLWAVLAASAYFEIGGGPLGVEMTDFGGNLGPVYYRDVSRVAGATNDELSNMPPVRVVFGSFEDGQLDIFVLVAGESTGVTLESLRDRFAAARALSNLLETAQSADLEVLRPAYSTFASELWIWRKKNSLDNARVNIDRLGGILPILTSAPMQIAIESMLVDGNRWSHDPQKRPFYGNKTGVFVSVGDPTDSRVLSIEQQKASAEMVLKLDDEHAQTFAYLMANWMVQNDGQAVTQRARVHVNDLLDFRDLKRKKRDFKPEQKREERDRILRLSEMWMTVRERVLVRGKKRKTKEVNVISRLIDLAIETDATGVGAPIPLLLEGMPTSSVPYAFRYEPGEWAKSYWADSQYVGSIFRKVLSYDTRVLAERMAMRIALYLSFVRQRRERTVRDLLAGAHIFIPTTMPLRSREAFEDALGRLRDDGITFGYEYVGGDPPISGKGWSARWLDSEISILSQPSPAELE